MRIFAAFLALLPLVASAAPTREVAVGRHAMVATEQHYATQAGVDVLRAGGNAVDAAVAVAYALAVVDPCCGNIGGGGFMLVRMHDGRERFIDFREKAPRAATRDMFLDARGNVVTQRSRKGWLAVGVPGTVLGMETARKEFGTRSRAALMAPAIALARDGFTVQAGDLIPFAGSASEGYGSAYSFERQANVRAIFMPRGHLPAAGDTVLQPQLARTRRSSAAAPTRFTKGRSRGRSWRPAKSTAAFLPPAISATTR
jgi:gamma-glutamyltranspeptidase/glutathione hydrolase